MDFRESKSPRTSKFNGKMVTLLGNDGYGVKI